VTGHETRPADDCARGGCWSIFLGGFYRRSLLTGRRTIHNVWARDQPCLALFQIVVAGIPGTIAWIAAHGKNPFMLPFRYNVDRVSPFAPQQIGTRRAETMSGSSKP
jgi:hypothetical protein